MNQIANIGGPAAAQARTTAAAEPARAASPLDRGKLDALRSAIQAGRYPLDPAKLAERLISVQPSAAR